MTSVILFNKPFGVVCQFSPAGARLTLADFALEPDIYPAGRLDADSEGLVLLTANGPLQNAIANPRMKLPKTYCAQVEGTVGADALERLQRGVRLSDYTSAPAGARVIEEPSWLWPRLPPIRVRRAIPTSWIELTLTEGKNRQVRRMTAAVGLPTLRLVRYAMGNWTLAGLAPGVWRKLEVEAPERRSDHGSRKHAARPRAKRG